MANNHNELSDRGFDQLFPAEVIEHIFSFCSGKDLLQLTETCFLFNEIISKRPLLMAKLTFAINWRKLKPGDKSEMEECFEARKFSAVRLSFPGSTKHVKNDPDLFFLPPFAEKLKEIKDLTIASLPFADMLFSDNYLCQLAIILLPKAETCKILCASNNQNGQWSQLEQQPMQCEFLTDLKVENCGVTFLSHLLLGCKNLKTFSIAQNGKFNTRDYVVRGESVWELVRFKLEKLEILGEELRIDEVFEEFLADQRKLQEMTIKGEGFDFASLLTLNANLNQINFGVPRFSCFYLNNIPHDQLRRIRFCVEPSNQSYSLSYISKVPVDMNAFEKDFCEFLDSETIIPGLKHSQVIASLKIGCPNWIKADVGLSEDFTRQMLLKLPHLKFLDIYTASPGDVLKAIETSIRESEFQRLSINGIIHKPQ